MMTPLKNDIIKYELRYPGGVNPFEQEQKKPGGFGRFLSGMGRFFGAVAAPLALVFPPAAIGAAAMYGAGAIGDSMQQRAYEKAMQKNQGPNYISFPGLDLGEGPAVGPNPMPVGATMAGASMASDQVMDVLFARQDMTAHSAEGYGV